MWIKFKGFKEMCKFQDFLDLVKSFKVSSNMYACTLALYGLKRNKAKHKSKTLNHVVPIPIFIWSNYSYTYLSKGLSQLHVYACQTGISTMPDQQCSAVQCSSVHNCVLQCSAVKCRTGNYSAVQICVLQWSAVQCRTVYYSTVQCNKSQCSSLECVLLW